MGTQTSGGFRRLYNCCACSTTCRKPYNGRAHGHLVDIVTYTVGAVTLRHTESHSTGGHTDIREPVSLIRSVRVCYSNQTAICRAKGQGEEEMEGCKEGRRTGRSLGTSILRLGNNRFQMQHWHKAAQTNWAHTST